MRVSHLFAAAAALTLSAASLQAQITTCNGTSVLKTDFASCTTTAGVSVDVPYLAQASTSGDVAKVTVVAADLNAGKLDFAGPSVTVKSNFTYTVTATAAAFSGGKAAGKLGIALTNGGTYEYLSAGRAIATSAVATATNTINTFLRLDLSWIEDAPGAQNTTLTFTVTAP